jgi:hypothetical protein
MFGNLSMNNLLNFPSKPGLLGLTQISRQIPAPTRK